jgi:hypothetical protein
MLGKGKKRGRSLGKEEEKVRGMLRRRHAQTHKVTTSLLELLIASNNYRYIPVDINATVRCFI